MKEKIKEILDNMQIVINDSIQNERADIIVNRLTLQNIKNKLLDYITNLQEQLHQASLDIQELTEKDIGCPSWCDKLTNLQEENKHLDEVNCKLRKGGEILKDTNKLLLQQKGQLQEDLDMLDKRIDKANTLLDELLEIAYIDGEYIMYDYSTSELLEVKQALQGEDKEC